METGSINSSFNIEYEPLIIIPGREMKSRIPGEYPDVPSKEKTKNNTSILHSCKLLNAYFNQTGIKALILDGREMRTTRTLQRLGTKLKYINIVEYNNQTYEIMIKKKIPKIHCHNCHIKEYIYELNDPSTNVVYFDIMSTLFTSKKSYGSDIIINEFLRQSCVSEMIFAATFCLRNTISQSHITQQKKILLLLNKMFILNGFNSKRLIAKNKLRYKGQNTGNKSMMFVLFYLFRKEGNK